MALIICVASASYRAYKEELKLTRELSQLVGPSYSELDLNVLKPKKEKEHYLVQSESQIKEKADEVGSEIAQSYFISNRIKYLNLKEANVSLNYSNAVRGEF